MKNKATLLNMISGLILQLFTLVSGFILPKIILIYFGSEVNGLVSSLNQFLSYITLVEGGITGVIVANLYKPIVDCLAANLKKIPQRIRWILQRFGNASYELYLTHVAIRAFMNLIGIRTYYLQNYILCVLVSLLLTSIIIKLQRMMIRAT